MLGLGESRQSVDQGGGQSAYSAGQQYKHTQSDSQSVSQFVLARTFSFCPFAYALPMTNLHYDPRLKPAEVGRGRTRMRSKESDASPVAIICLKSFLLFALKLRKIKIMFLTPATPLCLLLAAPPQLELKKSQPVQHVSLCL